MNTPRAILRPGSPLPANGLTFDQTASPSIFANTSAVNSFVGQYPGTVGTRGILRGPGMFDTDLAVSKAFRIHESHRVSIRGEAFNAFNNVQWNNPSSTNLSINAPTTFGGITSAGYEHVPRLYKPAGAGDAVRVKIRVLKPTLRISCLCLALAAARAQTPLPVPAPPPTLPTSVDPGELPEVWITGGPNCLEVPAWQIHEYNPALYILRESGCTNYEKPFLYLFFGHERVLLVDTGAGQSDAAVVVQGLIGKWLKREKRASIALVVAHSHGHGDHVAGDKGFAGMPDTTLVPATVEAVQQAFGIANWPEQAGAIDLGGRVLDVIGIPGHQAAAVAYYDRQTGILLTGDNLYPGRLYISDFPAYLASTQRLVKFTESRPVAHILGCHIEQSSTPYVDYPIGTTYQPHEHNLELGRAHLLELLAGLEQMQTKPVKLALRDFTIFPREPRPPIRKKEPQKR